MRGALQGHEGWKGVTENNKLAIHSISKCQLGTCQVEVTEPDVGCAVSFLKLWEETKVKEL